MTKYNHAISLAFEVTSEDPNGNDITVEMLKTALKRRIDNLDASTTPEWTEWLEACLPPWDTFEEN